MLGLADRPSFNLGMERLRIPYGRRAPPTRRPHPPTPLLQERGWGGQLLNSGVGIQFGGLRRSAHGGFGGCASRHRGKAGSRPAGGGVLRRRGSPGGRLGGGKPAGGGAPGRPWRLEGEGGATGADRGGSGGAGGFSLRPRQATGAQLSEADGLALPRCRRRP